MLIENNYILNDIEQVFFDDFFTVKITDDDDITYNVIIDKRQVDYSETNALYNINTESYYVLFKKSDVKDDFEDKIFKFNQKTFRLQNIQNNEDGIVQADIIYLS